MNIYKTLQKVIVFKNNNINFRVANRTAMLYNLQSFQKHCSKLNFNKYNFTINILYII